MSLDIEVRGDPAACRDAAARLTRLAEATDQASDALARQAHLSDHDFGGLSGDVFRDHTGRLAEAGDRASRRCSRLARALDELALDLEDVRALMELAAQAAGPWLAVGPTTIRPPTVAPRPADPWVEQAWSAWHRVVLLVDRAREIEHRAQHDWRTALWHFAGATPPSAPWDLDDVTDGAWPDAGGVPAYDPHLGPHLGDLRAHHTESPHGSVDAAQPPRPDHPAATQQAVGGRHLPAPQHGQGHEQGHGQPQVGASPADAWGCSGGDGWHAGVGHLTGPGHPPFDCGTTPVGALPGDAATPPDTPTPQGPVGPPVCGTSPVPEVPGATR